MIDLSEHGGERISGLPVQLRYVRSIERLDGFTLLAEFETAKGVPYVYYWCDVDRGRQVHRWAVVHTPQELLSQYMSGVSTLRHVIMGAPGGFCFMIDAFGKQRPESVWLIQTASLPSNYLPSEESFCDEETLTAKNVQDIAIAEHCGAEIVADYPRKYTQASIIAALFGKGRHAPSEARVNFDLTSGYVFKNQYDALRKYVPRQLVPRMDGLHFSSPGYLRFAVDESLSGTLRDAVTSLQENRDLVTSEVTPLRQWANERIAKHHPSKKGKRAPRPSGVSQDQALRYFESLCVHLGIAPKNLLTHCSSLEAAAKMILSYYSRIVYLADKDQKKMAAMVGLASTRRELPVSDDVAISDATEVKALRATARPLRALPPPEEDEDDE
jgi:hypothetical protein